MHKQTYTYTTYVGLYASCFFSLLEKKHNEEKKKKQTSCELHFQYGAQGHGSINQQQQQQQQNQLVTMYVCRSEDLFIRQTFEERKIIIMT